MLPSKAWTGNLVGTNTGKFFLEISQIHDGQVSGELRVNDDEFGIIPYLVNGEISGQTVTLVGSPEVSEELVAAAVRIRVRGELNQDRTLTGDWDSDSGTRGRFVAYSAVSEAENSDRPDEYHSVRHDFGPIRIGRSDIEELADFIQKHSVAPVVVSITTETTQNFFLPKFREAQFSDRAARIAQVRTQNPEAYGLNRTILLEFGPVTNFVQVQSKDEAWARGECEILKSRVRKYEQSYATVWRRAGFGINQLIFLGLLIVLPFQETLLRSAMLVASVAAISQLLSYYDKNILKNAYILLSENTRKFFGIGVGTILSWIGGVAATVAATLIATWLLSLGAKQ